LKSNVIFQVNNTKYINLGDWLTHNTYAVLEKGILKLEKYNK
jgi:hypothetical protein